MTKTIINKSNSNIAVGSHGNYAITGSQDLVTVGSSSTLSVTGHGDIVQLSGANDILTLGGNGANAALVNLDIATFAGGGTLHVLANSTVAAFGDSVKATLAVNDSLALFGAGDTVTGSSAGESVWIGLNSQSATGAKLDTVTLTAGGDVTEVANSSVVANGSNLKITMASNDTLSLNPASSASGDDNIDATGDHDVVNVAGTLSDTVAFDGKAGVLNLLSGATVVASGDGVTTNFSADGDDTLTLTGAGEVVNASVASSLEIGGNGKNATGAHVDVVNGIGASTVVLAYSHVALNSGLSNSAPNLSLTGDDTLDLNINDVLVNVTNGNNVVNVASNGQTTGSVQIWCAAYAADGVTPADDTINLQSNASVYVAAANSVSNLRTHDTLSLVGRNNIVNIAASTGATDDLISIQGYYNTTTVNDLSKSSVATDDAINVTASNTGFVNASHAVVKAIDYATVTVNGVADLVESLPLTTGFNSTDYRGSAFTVGGNGESALGGSLALADSVWLGDLDTLTVENNATVLVTPSAADPGHLGHAATVNIGADDYVALTGTYSLLSAAKTGADIVSGFAGADTLQLTSNFANTAALLAATTYAAGNATIHLDAADTIALVGVSQSQFTADVTSGQIKV